MKSTVLKQKRQLMIKTIRKGDNCERERESMKKTREWESKQAAEKW
jgi:hypothetical protein